MLARIARTAFWWTLTLILLFLVDDLVFGPIYWSIALYNRVVATVAAFLGSWSFGYWLVQRGTLPEPGRTANFFLSRLLFGRRRLAQVEEREQEIRASVTTKVVAVLATLIIGGTLTALLLHKRGLARKQVLGLAFWLCALYAVEFAILHGGWGFGGGLRSLIWGEGWLG